MAKLSSRKSDYELKNVERAEACIEEKEWKDDYFLRSREHVMLPKEVLNIRGLHMMGRACFERAFRNLKEHYHPDCMEVVVVIEGTQNYRVEGKDYTLFGGDVFTTFPDEIHGSGGYRQSVSEIIWFQLERTEVDGFLELRDPWDKLLFQKVQEWNRRVVKIRTEDIFLLQQTFQCFELLGISGVPEAEKQNKKLRGLSLLTTFLTGLLEAGEDKPELSTDILKITGYIEEHLTEPLTMEVLADAGRMSVSWMKTKFREQMGMSPREYVNYRKIEYAKILLTEEEESVTKIAYLLNFNSSNYFASVFKKMTGVSPKEYRKHYKNV